ncbi:MAG: TIGR04255 family protein [Guyparkeria sp.]
MSEQLPTKLDKAPLIDALFEIRFSGNVSVADALPGYLYSKLDGKKEFERLPISEMPKSLREQDPNLKYSPLTKLHWGDYVISIGDRSLSVACKMPYPGWAAFHEAIRTVVGFVKELDVIDSVHRFSLKYVDLLPSDDLKEQVSLIKADISVGGHELRAEPFHLRLEVSEKDLIHILTIASSAVVKGIDNVQRKGLIIDVDTIKSMDDWKGDDWVEGIFSQLSVVKSCNKKMFFNCLREETIESLGPTYV